MLQIANEFHTGLLSWDKIYSNHKQLKAKIFDLVKRTNSLFKVKVSYPQRRLCNTQNVLIFLVFSVQIQSHIKSFLQNKSGYWT